MSILTTDIVNSLQEQVKDAINGKAKALSIRMTLDRKLREKLEINWTDTDINIDGKESSASINLIFNTVAIFDERFNTVLIPSELDSYNITDKVTSKEVTIEDLDGGFSKPDLNTIISLLKMYMAQEQLEKGDVDYQFSYPFSIA